MDASNESPDVQGKVYAAFILDREPLFAALLKLDKADGVAYKKIETAVQLSGYYFRTNIVLEENDTLPRETVVASMQLWIDDRQQRFEKKFKTTLAIPVPSLKSGFVSGLSFMEKAAAIGLIKMEIVARCRLLKDPAISSRLPPSTLPELPSPAGASSLPPMAWCKETLCSTILLPLSLPLVDHLASLDNLTFLRPPWRKVGLMRCCLPLIRLPRRMSMNKWWRVMAATVTASGKRKG